MGDRKYADSELLDGLRRAAAAMGEPLTVRAYDDYRASHEGMASGIWVVRHFGSWRQACEAAGVTANATRSTSRRWTSDELVGFVVDYLDAPGSTGSYAGYVSWARETDGAPSGPTLRNSLGSWTDIKILAEQRREKGS